MNTRTVEAADWAAVALALRDQEGFDFLNVITAIDWLKQDKIEVVYHLYSYGRREELCVKIDLPRAQPHVPSVALIWRTAEWQEREQYDLVGVIFDGHPDLRRILLPEDWPGHPLRKDWTEPAAYNGMPTTRVNTLDLLPKADKER